MLKAKYSFQLITKWELIMSIIGSFLSIIGLVIGHCRIGIGKHVSTY